MINHTHSRREAFPMVGGLILGTVFALGRLSAAFAAQEVDCRIFMFHETSGAALEAVLFQNIRAGRIPKPLGEVVEMILGERRVPREPLFCLTFDDGYLVQKTAAVPVLEAWSTPATFFVMGKNWQGNPRGYMSPDDYKWLNRKGFEIGSHGLAHPANIVRLRDENLGWYQEEVVRSKRDLEGLLQLPVTLFASPNSIYDPTLVRDVMNNGYKAALATLGTDENPTTRRGREDLYNLKRERIN